MEAKHNLKRFNNNSTSSSFKSSVWSRIRKICRSKKASNIVETEPILTTSGNQGTDDYVEVQEDKYSSESISLYQCEMPAEKIKKLKVRTISNPYILHAHDVEIMKILLVKFKFTPM